ncbi:hypothetical protein GCM10009789_62640 [Kribbella sancticallisti]|uniref:Uncharacterized protein n=1 Tax=Kribbella sancticallisti TaxID=460087 RepID=A0ABP4Q3R6_9ACTN
MSDPSSRTTPPGAPRWVKWTLVIIGVLVVLFVVAQIAGVGGEHGPGRHGAEFVLTTAAHEGSWR